MTEHAASQPPTLAAAAREVATAAHAGQVDKSGAAYIGHPARVAARLTGDDAQAVGWLHDVVEDTPVTLDDLRRDFPDHVVAAVDALTRRPDEQPDDYYARVARDPLAVRVKLADVADNSDPARLAALDPATRDRLTAKYANARARLTGAGQPDP